MPLDPSICVLGQPLLTYVSYDKVYFSDISECFSTKNSFTALEKEGVKDVCENATIVPDIHRTDHVELGCVNLDADRNGGYMAKDQKEAQTGKPLVLWFLVDIDQDIANKGLVIEEVTAVVSVDSGYGDG